jgi:hypothetical protein
MPRTLSSQSTQSSRPGCPARPGETGTARRLEGPRGRSAKRRGQRGFIGFASARKIRSAGRGTGPQGHRTGAPLKNRPSWVPNGASEGFAPAGCRKGPVFSECLARAPSPSAQPRTTPKSSKPIRHATRKEDRRNPALASPPPRPPGRSHPVLFVLFCSSRAPTGGSQVHTLAQGSVLAVADDHMVEEWDAHELARFGQAAGDFEVLGRGFRIP